MGPEHILGSRDTLLYQEESLIPLGSYPFKCTGDPNKWFHWDTEQRVINLVPLNWTQVFLTWMKTAALYELRINLRLEMQGKDVRAR